jgi:Tfp pilus assembly protein PilX
MNGRWELTKNTHSLAARKSGKVADHGFALVFTLLLLSMMSLMALAMVFSSSSDMLINGYYRNARGSFYAADSGLNIARQQLESQILAQVPSTFTTNPIPASATATVCSNVLNTYASTTSLNAGQAASSWSESFLLPSASNCCGASCTVPIFSLAPNSPTVTSYDSNNNPNGYKYIYNYQLVVTGMAQGSEQTTVSETGSVILAVSGTQTTSTTSFAAYGAFIDQFTPCLGPLVPGTLTGPFFTNGAWQFGTSGSYIFTDTVGQSNADVDFWFGNTCIQSPTSSYKYGNGNQAQTIKPTFEGNPPLSLGLNTEALPQNDYSQQWAVLDSKGTGEGSSAPTASQMHTGNLSGSGGTPPYPPLQTPSGTAYPTSGASSGVYMPYTTSGSVNTFDGGGFWVAGDASITLSTSGASGQVFTIGQSTGSNTTTTTTITVDPLATPPSSWGCASGTKGTTSVTTQVTTTGWQGSTTTTSNNFCSVPMNQSATSAQPGTIIYVNGNIASSCSWGGNCTGGLSGPGQGVAGIQDYNAITIVANGNIDIEGDLIYNTEPVTTTQNQVVSGTNPACCNGDPADTLIPGHNNGQVLGIFTANGNINLNSNYSNNNLEVDASMAALQAGQNYGFSTNEGSVNTVTNVGGRIENAAHGVNITTFNVYFDQRFANTQGFAPPWFPSTTVTATGPAPAVSKPTIQRVQWALKNM